MANVKSLTEYSLSIIIITPSKLPEHLGAERHFVLPPTESNSFRGHFKMSLLDSSLPTQTKIVDKIAKLVNGKSILQDYKLVLATSHSEMCDVSSEWLRLVWWHCIHLFVNVSPHF